MILITLFIYTILYQLTVFFLLSFPAIVIQNKLLTTGPAGKKDLLLTSKTSDNGTQHIEKMMCEISAGCGSCRNVTEEGGIIESPNYPEEYSPDSNCLYTISAPAAGKRIQLNFTEFVVEKCCDFLAIFDKAADPLRIALNGYDAPDNITSLSERMLIKFSTDSRNNITLDESHNSNNLLRPARWQAVYKFI